jgi:hypothetical protein
LWEGGFVRDFENFTFLHVEMRQLREKRVPIQSGVVGGTIAKKKMPLWRFALPYRTSKCHKGSNLCRNNSGFPCRALQPSR